MRKSAIVIVSTFFFTALAAQSEWVIQHRDREIQIDGFLNEWEGVSSVSLIPGDDSLRSSGEFGENDVSLVIQALWDDDYLYLALTWKDDVWDIEEVTRRDAVWVDAEKKRRDRMYFFDNLKFHIRRSDYDYTFWISPVHDESGPFYWNRLLEGFKGMERATGAPMVTARENSDGVTMEILLLWEQLKLEPEKEAQPLTLVLSDADDPGRVLEYKLNRQKWVAWIGQVRMVR